MNFYFINRKPSSSTIHPQPLEALCESHMWPWTMEACSVRFAVQVSLPFTTKVRMRGGQGPGVRLLQCKWLCLVENDVQLAGGSCLVPRLTYSSYSWVLRHTAFLYLGPKDSGFTQKKWALKVTRLAGKSLLDSGGDFYSCRISCCELWEHR